MSGPEPRPIARHRAPRRRLSAVARPYPVVVAGVVTLVSVPVLASVLVGSAAVTPTSSPRAPFVADPSQDPVTVPGAGAAMSPTSGPTDLSTPTLPPTLPPAPTPSATDGRPAASVIGAGATASAPGTPCRESAAGRWGSDTGGRPASTGGAASSGGSPSRSGATLRSTPAPQPTNAPVGGGSALDPVPVVPPVQAPSIPGILPAAPVAPLPPLVPGVVPGLGGAVGGLLGVLVAYPSLS